ncbi:hypothetical protein PEDI_06750 [Persicobacter diffluens]|uniref:Uncharacterized protein n=1 Tax=Persicobacter diffluens TaxID=981 RepID=A0AAN4VWB9_9BACT|nr:hypothetical protein PEDI_06750 [Persicobacter diffluens]
MHTKNEGIVLGCEIFPKGQMNEEKATLPQFGLLIIKEDCLQ